MTPKRRILAVVAAATLILPLAACAPAALTSPPGNDAGMLAVAVQQACSADEGVTLLVDSSALAGGERVEWCVFANEAMPASDVLETAQITTDGTEEYGDQVVCRVNGLPSPDQPVGSVDDPDYIESCASMPAAFAYWSLWVRPASDADWGSAEEGLATLELQPGESVGLLFTLDGAPAAPTP